jgi:HAD superfamily hydrolase (TIGR01509 family)
MIRALIFDFDGLILETEGPSYQSWEAVYRSFGLSLPFSTWSTIIGTTQGPFDPARELQRQVRKDIDWEAVEFQRMASEQELIEAQTILPGVEQYLQEARRLGLKTGLASSSSCHWVMGHLIRIGLVHYFDCIRASDDVDFVKPHPELYLSVLQGLGVKAGEAIAFEDSPNGIRSAKQAGIFCVAVPNPLTKQLPLSQADLLLGSLAEMDLVQLLEKVNASET